MRHLFSGHDCTSVQRRGWRGTKNGALLALAVNEFDLFITSDQNIRYQQNLLGSSVAIWSFRRMIFAVSVQPAAMIQSEIRAMKPGAYRKIVIP